MSERSIPPATNDQFSVALTGVMTQAKSYGIDTTDPTIHSFLVSQAEVRAQLEAEAHWLRGLTHPR